MRTDVIIVDNFYAQPDDVRKYALSQPHFYPYQNRAEIESGREKVLWETTYFKMPKDCPFKSSKALIKALEKLTGDSIDMDDWNKGYPVDEEQNHLPDWEKHDRTSRYNCCFHIKYTVHEKGTGVHNHATDTWNNVGELGWNGLIYLTPEAPLEAGFMTWRNKAGQQYEANTSKERWELVDQFANVYNRLILCRGWIPHSGGSGFADTPETGRLFQTFFFKTKKVKKVDSLEMEADFGVTV